MSKVVAYALSLGLMACSPGGSGTSSDVQHDEIHDKENSIQSEDITKKDPSGNGFIRTLKYTIDYLNSDGINSYRTDLPVSTGNTTYVEFKAKLEDTCGADTEFTLFAKKSNDGVARLLEIQTLKSGDSFELRADDDYFIQTQVNLPHGCKKFKLVVTAKMPIRFY
jgi:hypothetical protein